MAPRLTADQALARVADAVEPALWALTATLSTELAWGHAAFDVTRAEALPFAATVDLSPSGERADALARLTVSAARDGDGIVLQGVLVIGGGATQAETRRLRVGPDGVEAAALGAWLAEAEALITAAEAPLRALGRGVLGG
ncbi:hypothetical protein L6R49_21060 [Myxococcota bacterium]|nr:hypothetical protein [Myxococcota bacterium]